MRLGRRGIKDRDAAPSRRQRNTIASDVDRSRKRTECSTKKRSELLLDANRSTEEVEALSRFVRHTQDEVEAAAFTICHHVTLYALKFFGPHIFNSSSPTTTAFVARRLQPLLEPHQIPQLPTETAFLIFRGGFYEQINKIPCKGILSELLATFIIELTISAEPLAAPQNAEPTEVRRLLCRGLQMLSLLVAADEDDSLSENKVSTLCSRVMPIVRTTLLHCIEDVETEFERMATQMPPLWDDEAVPSKDLFAASASLLSGLASDYDMEFLWNGTSTADNEPHLFDVIATALNALASHGTQYFFEDDTLGLFKHNPFYAVIQQVMGLLCNVLASSAHNSAAVPFTSRTLTPLLRVLGQFGEKHDAIEFLGDLPVSHNLRRSIADAFWSAVYLLNPSYDSDAMSSDETALYVCAAWDAKCVEEAVTGGLEWLRHGGLAAGFDRDSPVHVDAPCEYYCVDFILPVISFLTGAFAYCNRQAVDSALKPWTLTHLLDNAAADTMLTLLDHPHRGVLKYSCELLAVIASGEPDQTRFVLRFLDTLVPLMGSSSGFDIRREAAVAVVHLSLNHHACFFPVVMEGRSNPLDAFLDLFGTCKYDRLALTVAVDFIDSAIDLWPPAVDYLVEHNVKEILEMSVVDENTFNRITSLLDRVYAEIDETD